MLKLKCSEKEDLTKGLLEQSKGETLRIFIQFLWHSGPNTCPYDHKACYSAFITPIARFISVSPAMRAKANVEMSFLFYPLSLPQCPGDKHSVHKCTQLPFMEDILYGILVIVKSAHRVTWEFTLRWVLIHWFGSVHASSYTLRSKELDTYEWTSELQEAQSLSGSPSSQERTPDSSPDQADL